MTLICAMVQGEAEQTKNKVINTEFFSSLRWQENNHSLAFNVLNRNHGMFWIYSLLSKSQFLVCTEVFVRVLVTRSGRNALLSCEGLGGTLVLGLVFFLFFPFQSYCKSLIQYCYRQKGQCTSQNQNLLLVPAMLQ